MVVLYFVASEPLPSNIKGGLIEMSLFKKQSASGPLGGLLNRPRPSAWQQFWSQPCLHLARKFYTSSWLPTIPAEPITDFVSIVCVSDTHNCQPELPDGDVLIHAGDLTQSGSLVELRATVSWLRAQPHAVKIAVAGNHDLFLDASLPRHKAVADRQPSPCSSTDAGDDKILDWGDVIYLQDAETIITCANGRRLRVYGSPLSPRHGNWAFQYPRSKDIWGGQVPDDTDILITHGPPRGHLDLLTLGCVHLIRELWRVRPRLHVFGHVHEGAGTEWLHFDALQDSYERVAVFGGGIWRLVCVFVDFMLALFFRRPFEARCLLVNPAIVGGLRDDERRRPIRVTI